jgi:hypothetical protein
MEVNRHHAGIFECIISGYSCSEDFTHRHSAAPRTDSCRYPGIMRDVSHKVQHHLQHECATLPDTTLCLHGFEPLRGENVRASRILVNNHSRTVPVVHQHASGRRDTKTECQRKFVGVVNVTFDKSLRNNKDGNIW